MRRLEMTPEEAWPILQTPQIRVPYRVGQVVDEKTEFNPLSSGRTIKYTPKK